MAAKSDGPVHRVVMIPRRPDGSPAIEGDYEVIGDKDFATRAAAEQLGQIAVSNADHARAREQAAAVAGAEPSLTPDEQARVDAHRDLMTQAARQAAGEVGSAHSGDPAAAAPLERSVPVETATTRTARKSS